jgi:hypothetical protein
MMKNSETILLTAQLLKGRANDREIEGFIGEVMEHAKRKQERQYHHDCN